MQKIHMFELDTVVYDLPCRSVDLAGANASLLSCEVAPGESSEAHNHFENEIFIFTSGSGTVTSGAGGPAIPVHAGDAVLFDRFENHVITNTDAREPLRFHSIYWASTDADAETGSDRDDRPALIFSTPPTPNGDLHLGHLSGPYLVADVLRRTLSGAKRSAYHLTGRDDHQTYVVTRAEQNGNTPRRTADHFADAIRQTLTQTCIPLDGFIEPDRDGAYAAFVRAGIRRLIEGGYIVADERPALFDRHGRYLHEAFVSGTCPHCGEGSDGNACEACGRPNQCVDMGGPFASRDGGETETATVPRLYFRLSKLSNELAQYVKSAAMPAHVADLALSMIDDGLPDICISHPGEWGIAHDAEGFEDQIVYVWFEMAFGYLWGAADLPIAQGPDPFARAASVYDGSVQIVHCYGFDNAYYHTLLFPAVYLALGLTPPSTHLVNELLDLDGAKFSTSRGHLIQGRELLDWLPADYVRFALASRRPEGTRSNFVLKETLDDLNNLFPGKLAQWLDHFRRLIGAADARVPEPGAWLADQRIYFDLLQTHARTLAFAATPETFSPRLMARVAERIVHEGADFLAAQQPLFDGTTSSGANYRRTSLALSAAALGLLTRVATPLMPDLGRSLSGFLNLSRTPAGGEPGVTFFEGGHRLDPTARISLPPARSDIGLPGRGSEPAVVATHEA